MAESNASKFSSKITSDGTIGQGGLAAGVGGTDWQSTIVTGTTLSAVAGKGYWIDTTSNACTITLPASASVGDTIEFSDYARTWNSNNVTINQNSLNYQGSSAINPIYDVEGQSVRIVYSGTTKGWIPTVDDEVTNEVTQPEIEFLVVGGGGSGGADDGGGGGAGGYRTSTQSAAIGTVITVTVGDGGAAVGQGTHGNDGSDSSISGSGLTTITSAGGGGGGFRSDTDNSSGRVGADGGSGGGGSINSGGTSSGAGGSGDTPSTTPSQGNDGGASASNAPYGGGGGGGASQAGSNGVASGAGGDGGDGTANSITGSSVTYAGGGGGSNRGGTAGSGGAGGGGAGSNTSGVDATAGTANLGGGGGGVPHSNGNSGAGGKGVVILRMLAAVYTGTTSGSPTVSDDGSYKVLTFTGSGSYTA